jgi:mono/diheme cytochrome c family protein
MQVNRPWSLVIGLLLIVLGLSGAALAQSAPDSQDAVKRGEYLARAGDCVSCHTKPGGTPYAGGLRMNTPFGDLLTPNITPDRATGIGTWTADDLYRALHEGVGKNVGDLYPAMPYTFFTKVTRADSDAIYAYLMSLKPVTNAVDVNQLRFPFDIRWTMAAWRELYFTEGTFQPDPAKSDAWNRGAYLVNGLGHCGACHTPRNALGAVDKSRSLTGAAVDGWFALNLTENMRTGLGDWSESQIVAYLKTGAAKSESTALGDMREIVHNSLSHLTEDDLQAIATYLKSIPADQSAFSTGPSKPVGDASAHLYLEYCAGCHQSKGRGIPGVFPPLAGNDVVRAPDPADILRVVLQGVPRDGRYIPMPSFAAKLSDQQIADIANYVRTRWGNDAPPNVTPQMVSKARASISQ